MEKKVEKPSRKLEDLTKEELIALVKKQTDAYKELLAENTELRRFVNYVRGLKTLADFKKLRTIVAQINNQFKK